MGLENFFEEKRDQFLRESLMSDSFLDFVNENMAPMERLMSYYRCAIMEIETKFRVLNEQFSMMYDQNPIESIKSREKSIDSLIRKIRKKNLPLTLEAIEENIFDIAGVRVVCSFVEDIYMLAECLLRQDDIRLIEMKDYIKNPKASGYRSLHLIVEVPIFLSDKTKNVKVEVQLRTIAMDFWASLEHRLRYKKNIPPELVDRLAEELYSCAEESAELDQRMQDVYDQLEERRQEVKKETKKPRFLALKEAKDCADKK